MLRLVKYINKIRLKECMQKISISSKKRCELIDITTQLASLVKNVEKGVMMIYCPHTTAGIIINEGADPDVQIDILNKLKELIPENRSYHHTEGNADAHIKSTVTGISQNIFIEKGILKLGSWQKIFFAEFDGPRNREVFVQIMKGETHDV